MQIKFDYRFDTTGFFTEEHQAALDFAGDIWSSLLQDDFTEVPVNTNLTIQNPQTGIEETFRINEPIDDLIVFVGAANEPFNGLANNNNNNSLAQGLFFGNELLGDIFQRRISDNFRGEGAVTDFEPWVGAISFAANPDSAWDLSLDNPDRNSNDFVSVALREIGRILGVGTAPIFQELTVDGAFTGVNVTELNDGNPLDLDGDLASLILGTAQLRSPNDLDLAFLADIGYEIAGFSKQGSSPAIATGADEVIRGTTLGDRIRGLAGNDEIDGNSGNDTLSGDEGDDSLMGAIGNDLLLGGAGIDSLLGDEGDDTLRGNDGDDLLFGGAGNDSLIGNSDNDLLEGETGEDIVRGGDGLDTVFGNEENDTVEGGRANDILTGGAGSDRFEFGFDFGIDRVTDFVVGEDRLFVSVEYDFATDSYDFNNAEEIIAAISNTVTNGDLLETEIIIRETNKINLIHDRAITTADVAIYFPFQAQVTSNQSGFTIQLNQDFQLDSLNLYQGVNSNADIPDLRLVNSTGRVIRGSLVPNLSDRSLTFVSTDSILAPDEYSLTLFSRGDSFLSSTGELLDGDRDGIAGNNAIADFTIGNSDRRVLNFDDFSQGQGEKAGVSFDEEGLVISLDDGTDITQVEFTVAYDPSILTLEDIKINPELSPDWTITSQDLSNPGTANLVLSGTNSLTSGEVDLVMIEASIPDSATQGKSGIINLEAVTLNGGEIAGIGDSGVQLVNSLGDTNGDGNHSSQDVNLVSQLATGIRDGLSDFPLINPHTIADLNNDGVISALDSYLVFQQIEI